MIGHAFQKLVEIVEKLRNPDGCPWDKEQTHESLRPYLLEETYEVLESIDNQDFNGLKEELGDLLLQSVFHAQIAKENKNFNIFEVLEQINNKLIRRHPHVFGNAKINTADEQHINWERIKKKEGKKSVLDGVPRHAPALLRAYRIQRKAATVGFDWTSIDPVWEKMEEEIQELKEALIQQDRSQIEEEFGDLLFVIVNLSRFCKINAEDALRQAVDKFIDRFQQLENILETEGETLQHVSLKEMDEIWNRIKKRKHSE